MIKTINVGQGLSVNNGHASDPYISPGSVGAGQMRWNPNINCIEVNDGNMWKQLHWTMPTIELTPDVRATLAWAAQEQKRQLVREHRIKDNPALQKAYEAIKRAEANFDLLDKIAGECEVCEQVQSSP